MNDTDARDYQNRFFAQNRSLRGMIDAMAGVPGLCVYVKNVQSCYIFSNEAHRVIYDRIHWTEMIGKKASDFHPPLLGEAYEINDRQIFDSKRPLLNEIWLVPTIRGTPRWFLSNKTPLFADSGELIGLCGLLSPISTPDDQLIHFGRLKDVIEHVENNYVDEITAEDLARIADLSIPQFNRRFRQLLRISPMEYVFSLRIQRAQELLSTTKRAVSDVAASTGFYDQSHFTKRFKKVVGMTPLEYRKAFFK